jgi:ribonuclease E
MLETEPQNRQPDPNEPEGSRQGSGQEGSQRRGLLRRTRRTVTNPAEPPAFRSGAPDAQQDTGHAAGSGGEAGGSQANSRANVPVPAVPGMSAARSEDRRAAAGAAHQPVPAAAFQAPVVVFQPPDLSSERRPVESGRSQNVSESAPADDSEAAGTGARRRRRGGRGRGKGSGGESGTSQGQGGGQGSAAQGSGGQAGAAVDGGSAAAGAGSADSGAGEQRRGQGERGQAERGQAGRAESGKSQSAGKEAEARKEIEGAEADGEIAADGEAAVSSSSRRRRRRRQRSGSGADADIPAPDDPTDTVVHVREPRPAESDDVRAVKGSTRLEAKRQRRRESRDTGRRRPPIISESEFLARREAVERVMVVRQQGDRTQIAVLEDGVLVEHYVDKASHQSYVGNVYLGKVQNVLPSMEAAFVDVGKGRNAVLYAGEVNFDATGLEGVAKRIESALKSGQSIMVQVTKDPIGHKGARLTSQISLPGRYLVYVPGASMTGISRKLPDTERARLKQILKKVAPEEGGIIVRTAAEGASEEELLHDVTRLVAQWQAIERKAKTANAPDLLYGEPDLTIRVVRDIFNEDFTKLVISSDSEWDLVDDYVRYVAPNLSDRLERWSDEAEDDLFAAYRIDEQLAKALDRKVWLPSGGSLVIDTTEAMTVIDVNTGKFTGQGGNLEQTVTRNNLEAAEEIVRQLRLRDIGGIIVIDFIDMVLESNRDLVLRRLIECLARDRTKHQVAEVTSLGLVQMTRKRVGSGLLAAFSVPCEHCSARGVLISTDLTEVHSHGKAGLSPVPKPGPARSRSARSKAIAEVAAKTLEPQQAARDEVAAQPAGADGQIQEPAPAGSAIAEPVTAELVMAEPKAAEPKAAEPKAGQSRAARSASTRARRSERAANEQRAEAEPAQAVPTTEQADAQPLDGESDSSVSPRRKVRRSAYREAGPPDSAQSDASVPSVSPDAADAGPTQLANAELETTGATTTGATTPIADTATDAGGAEAVDGQQPAAEAGPQPVDEHGARPADDSGSQPTDNRDAETAPVTATEAAEMQSAHRAEG